MKKPRSDSKLDALTEEQHAQLAEWLTVENLSYAEARTRVAEQFGITTSAAALQGFYSRFAAPWKYARDRHAADEFAELLEGNFEPAALKRVRQLAFESLSGPQPDIGVATQLLQVMRDGAKLSLQKEKLSLDARRVKLLEEKAALADRAKAIAGDNTLTEEEQGRRMRALFRMNSDE